jgi:hypothetical protein
VCDQILYEILIFPMRVTFPAHVTVLHLITLNMFLYYTAIIYQCYEYLFPCSEGELIVRRWKVMFTTN